MRSAGGTALFAIAARASNQIAVIVVTLVATRYLGPAEFGVFALASIMVMLPRNLLYAGPYEFLLKSADGDRWSSACCLAMLALAALALCILAAVSPLWPRVFGSGDDGTFLLVLAGSILPCAIAAWQESLLLREGRVTTYYGVTVASELAAAAAAIALLIAGHGLAALATQLYMRSCLLVLLFRLTGRPPPLRKPHPGDFHAVLRWSSSRYGSVIANFASNYSSDLILGVIMGPTATGLYRAANRLVTAVSDVVSQPTNTLSITALSRLRASGQPLDGRWLTMFAGIAWFGVPALVGLAVLSDLVAPVALGPQWAAAAPVIAILCIARLFALLNLAPSAALVAYDRQRWLFSVQLGAAIASVCAALAAAPLGISAVAWTTTAVTMLSTLLIVYGAKRISNRQADWRTATTIVLPPTVAVAAAAFLARESFAPLLSSSLMLLFAAATAGCVAWLAVVFVIRKRAFAALQVLTHAH